MNQARAIWAMLTVAATYLSVTGAFALLAFIGLVPWAEASEVVEVANAIMQHRPLIPQFHGWPNRESGTRENRERYVERHMLGWFAINFARIRRIRVVRLSRPPVLA